MFRTRLATEPPTDDVTPVPADLVPLSVLALDLPEIANGWATYLADLGVAVVLDDVGRAAVHRSDARRLLTERRERQETAARIRAEAEQRAVEQDQEWRASLHPGIPWHVFPAGVDPARALMEAEQEAQYAGRPQSVTAALLEAELSGQPGSLVYHSLQDEEP